MKKALFISLCTLLVASACCKKNAEPEPQKVAVTGVSLKPNTLSLKVGEAETLSAVVIPANADNKTVSWSTSDPSVATVANGLVTAVKEGSATITVTTADGGKTATCAVTVSTDIVPVTGITIDQGATAEVEEGNTITLTATVQPENATDKTVTWSSSNDDIATVANGAVTGVTPGEAVITAKAGDKTATCTVTVNSAIPAYEAVDLGLSVKWGNKNVGAEFPEDPGDYFAWGETAVKDNYTLENYVFGPDLTQASKYFGSGRTVLEEADDAARVNLGEGWRMPTQDEWDELIHQCTAQWTTQNDKTGVLVTAQSGASIFLPAAGVCNDYGNPWSLGAQGFYWSSSPVSEKYGLDWLTVVATHIFDPGVAEYGVIESVYGSLYEGYSVRPVFAEYVHVTGVSLNKDTETLAPDETLQLTATVSPENALEKAVKWTSSDETVATVTKGLVTAKGTGTATITVTTFDGEKTATCTVTVKAALPTDALSGEFSVSGTKKVHFSQGNLVATINASGTPTAWKFAANQYDYIGSATANTSIGSTAGDIDLFGWSTAATKYGISTSTTSLSDYSGDFVDWGTAIDDKGTWRTLTTAEWQYLFNGRSNASSLYKNGVTVCGKENCLIIAPDNWDTSAKPLNASYDATAWATAETAGLVCLPAAGRRRGSDVGYVGDRGYYWSSTAFDGNYAYYVVFNSSDVCSDDCDYRSRGFSVRLITESK